MKSKTKSVKKAIKKVIEQPVENFRYILDNAGNVIPCPDLMKWGTWMQEDFESGNKKRQIANTKVGELTVSTVFLGLDHTFIRNSRVSEPVLWETMIFGVGSLTLTDFAPEERYTSKEDALKGHAVMVRVATLIWKNIKIAKRKKAFKFWALFLALFFIGVSSIIVLGLPVGHFNTVGLKLFRLFCAFISGGIIGRWVGLEINRIFLNK